MILIDADIICYRVGFAAGDEELGPTIHSACMMVADIIAAYPDEEYQLFLTGKGNYREQIAKTAEYKGNRKDKEKPPHLEAIRKALVDEYDAHVIDGMEADDAIAIEHTAHNYESVICSLDKDFDQLPGRHYNFVKKQEYTVTEEQALRFLYEQILTGDRADNIIGIHGIGPKKAQKLLEGCETERQMYEACVKAYEKIDGAAHPVARVVENANLVYLLRDKDSHWTVPEQDND